jgi:hypothetical protein
MVMLMPTTSGDSSLGVLGILFWRIQESFTTQGSPAGRPGPEQRPFHRRVKRRFARARNPRPIRALVRAYRSDRNAVCVV